MPSDPYEWVDWTSAHGAPVRLAHRPDTTDWNTLYSCVVEDEYDVPTGITGWALDIGAHVGGATVALGTANPGLRIVAVEPLPENLDMLALNIEANALADRVVVLAGAVAADVIGYDFDGEGGAHHRYIGNAYGPQWAARRTVAVPRFDMADLLAAAGVDEFAFAKIDCEGGEWGFLGPGCSVIRVIAGEWHPVDGHVRDDVTDALADFAVTFTGPPDGPGGFRAVRAR